MLICMCILKGKELKTYDSLALTWVKGTAVHVCFMSFRFTGKDILPPLSMTFCHICRPCFFFSSNSVGVLGRRLCSGFTGALLPTAWPGRPRDKKVGKGSLVLWEGALLGVSPLLKNPDWVRVWWSSCTTLTIPWTGSSGPLPDDSKSTLDPFTVEL